MHETKVRMGGIHELAADFGRVVCVCVVFVSQPPCQREAILLGGCATHLPAHVYAQCIVVRCVEVQLLWVGRSCRSLVHGAGLCQGSETIMFWCLFLPILVIGISYLIKVDFCRSCLVVQPPKKFQPA